MTILDTLITDRTQNDVDLYLDLNEKGYEEMYPDERAAWDTGLKGAYDYRDMNRVVGAIEYIDHLMVDAKRQSVYEPVIIPHKIPVEFDEEGTVTQWEQWADKIWIDYDFPTPLLWSAHLANINRLWEVARRFDAVVLPQYDPDGCGYIKPGTVVEAGEMFKVLESIGLLELRVTAVCPPEVTVEGTGWTVTQTGSGWVAALGYTDCPYPDINDALSALKITSGEDTVVDGLFTLSATLRYDYNVTAGTCAVRWSPFATWGAAGKIYGTWGGAKPLNWGEAGRGIPLD